MLLAIFIIVSYFRPIRKPKGPVFNKGGGVGDKYQILNFL
jgi:hypothetical protein